MKYIILIFLITICSCSCSKNSSGPLPPANLQLTTNVKADNSGTVDFVAKADNATSYDFDFGNGIFQTSSNGSVSYKYPTSGTYTVKVTAKNAGGDKVMISKDITVTTTLSLVWSDEFDGNGAPNPAKWVYDLGAGGWGNNELQYYTNSLENAFVSNGKLKIIAKKQDFSGSQYTSARLKTQGKFDFKYGKVEVRAKLPTGVAGIWPAAWMLGSNITTAGWPASGEIDIMEYLTRDPEYIYATFHYPARHGGNADGNKLRVPNATADFHIFSLEWSPSLLKILVDGQQIHSLANNSTLPFNSNFFVILNMALGGNFGGALDPAFNTAQMEVDYVRVYQ